MNFHDSGLIADGLLKHGFEESPSADAADIVILNTCSVRDHADHKIVSDIGRLKSGKKIVLAGCFANQIKLKKENGIKDNKTRLPVDYFFGPDEILSIPEILADDFKKEGVADSRNKKTGHCRRIDNGHEKPEAAAYDDYKNFNLIEDYFYNKKINNDIAAIKITEGCDNFCSYCIVPFVRGAERSIPHDIIFNSAAIYAAKGVREIVLLGQNVNSYLSPDDSNKNFSLLLESLSKINGIKKIKFLTSHPRDFNDELLKLICENDKISKSIHLPVQSGSDKILSAMNRGYTRRQYLNLIEKFRKQHSDIAFSTDIIVGYPDETDDDFNQTLSLIDEVGFDFIFGFKYSPRPFTKAFDINDGIPLEKKKERLDSVLEKQKNGFKSILNSLKGKRLNVTILNIDKDKNPTGFKNGVLFRGEGLNDRTIYITGKNAYDDVHKDLKAGDNVNIKITEVKNNRLYAEVSE